MAQIKVPIMMFSGSNDIVATAVEEQIHPFIWTGSENKYLALLTRGTHFTVKPGDGSTAGFITLLAGEHRDIGARYFKEFNVAFWNTYLKEQTEFLPYLSARYGDQTSEGEPLTLDIVDSLTPEALVAAYGKKPPVPIIPAPSDTAMRPERQESVLAEIKRTGVLKVAFRQDAAPFGYIDDQSNWVGYCRSFATDLQSYVDSALDLDVDVELVEIPSTLDNRFSLVQDDILHVECGPNTIRRDIEGVSFSNPLLVAGAQVLLKKENVDPSDPNPRLDNLRVAVLPGSTTEQFVRERFPQATLVPFSGPTGVREAITALSANEVDAFANDGILSSSELLRQNLPVGDYALLPKRPLTCEFYGLILPDDDVEWQTLINNFLKETHIERLKEEIPSALVAGQIETLDYCLNQVSN